jgi:hypothetical protein
LYYNRRFTASIDPRRPGSYSSTFIPDFTLIAFPEPGGADLRTISRVEAERQEQLAEEQNLVCYWHFDAKYKFDKDFIKSFHEKSEADGDKDFLEEEKESIKAEGRFKRADLFKMHAYNDAIRRTAGSYVLYPGEKRTEPFRKFHELIPGVGAFVVKPPASKDKGLASAELGRFIREAIHLRRRPGSNLNNLREAEHSIASGIELIEPHGEIIALIGWYRTKAIADFCIKKAGIFYWRLEDKNGIPERIDPKAKIAQRVIPYNNGKWCGVRLKVKRYEEMSSEELAALVASHGKSPAGLPGDGAKKYGVLILARFQKTDLLNSQEIDKLNGVKFGREGDTQIHLIDFIRNGHRPLCLPHASLFQSAPKSADSPIDSGVPDSSPAI